MAYLPIDELIKDAAALARQFSDGSNPIRDTLTADVICHVKALGCEIERLRLYERAMQSMAAQYVHPKMTAEELAKMQLGEE